MNKILTTLIGIFGFISNFENIGYCMNNNVKPDIISFKSENGEMESLLPVLKEIGKEDLKNRFDYASKELISTVKHSSKVSDIIDTDALAFELQLKKNALKENNLELLENRLFTEISIPLILNNTSNLNKKLSIVQDFILFNHGLREALWYAPIGYKRNFPKLDFVADLTLMYRNAPINGILNENILCLIMAGIEMDLQTNPHLRCDDVPENTRLLFSYFKQCKNCDNDPVKKIYSYQKYLTQEQNNNLSLQLLSIYLNSPQIYNCEEYMEQLAIQLFFYADCKDLLQSIDPWHRNLLDIFQQFLRHQLRLEPHHNTAINYFVSNVLNRQILDINLNKNVLLHNLLEQKLNKHFKEPIKNKFLNLKKVLAKKDDKLFSKKFVNTMCNGCCGLLDNTLSFYDFYNIQKIYKIFFVPPANE